MSGDHSPQAADPPEEVEHQRSEEEEEERTLHDFVILDLEGNGNSNYSVGSFEFGTGIGDCCELIVICEIDGRFLVGVPEAVWHRQVAKRIIPPKCLQRPTLVSVNAFRVGEEEEEESGLKMKIWCGFLEPKFEGLISFGIHLEPIHGFSTMEERMLPATQSLVDIAGEHYSFRSAESGLERGGGGRQKQPTEAERLKDLEENLASLTAALQSLKASLPDQPAPRPSALKAKPKAKDKKKDVRGLEPAVVQSALSAGVPAQHLKELGGILREKPRRLDDLERKAAKTMAGPLDDIPLAEEEDEPDLEMAVEAEEGTGGSGMEAAIIQLTKIASHLTESKRRDPLEQLLDVGASGASGSDGSGLPTSKRNAAALRALQKCLKENPKYIYQCLEANLQSDFLSRPMQPGEPLTAGTTARGWLAAKSRVLNYTNHVRWSWQAAGIWDALMAGNSEEARARSALLVASADQSSIDGGNWLLANASLLESPPPYQLFSSHHPPAHFENQYSALYDPRWLDIFMGHVKELESYQEARKKLGRNGLKGRDDKEDDPAPKLKAKAKAGKGRDGKGKNQSEETGA